MAALLALPALAHHTAAGRKIVAGVCQGCYGLDGPADMPEMPNIAGDDASYIVRQLAAYRSGARQNEMMSAVAPMLDDAKIADAAPHYSSLRVTVTLPSGSKEPRRGGASSARQARHATAQCVHEGQHRLSVHARPPGKQHQDEDSDPHELHSLPPLMP